MKTWPALAPLAALAMLAQPASAGTKDRIDVIGIPAAMPMIANTRCVAPNVCLKKGETRIASYDPGIIGSPKFRPGDLILRDGTRLSGRIALLNLAADWDFVKQVALIVLDGETAAIFIGPGDALLIHQAHDKDGAVIDAYDCYGNGYLRRLVSGRMRLSYNPAAGTSRSLASFVPAGVLANLSGALGREAVIASLKDGRSVRESLSTGRDAGGALADVVSSISITEKEYLLYDEAADRTVAITKTSYRGDIERLFAGCAAADAKTVKGFAGNYGKVEAAVGYFNATCG